MGCVCRGGDGGQNTVRKIQVCPIGASVTLRLCPSSRKGNGERARGVGGLFPLPEPDSSSSSSSSSPLHSVLSSRCQEVAQCMVVFFFFSLLTGCMILHVFLFYFVCFFMFFFLFVCFPLQSQKSRLVVKKFQVGLCVCVSSCPSPLTLSL